MRCTCAVADSFNVRASDLINDTCPLHGRVVPATYPRVSLEQQQQPKKWWEEWGYTRRRREAIDKIMQTLGAVSEGCISPERAEDIATRAVDEALVNMEGK